MTDSPTHAYVTRDTNTVHSVLATEIAPGSNSELAVAQVAPAGCDLVDITALEAIPDEGDQLVIDSDGCAIAIVD